MLLGVSGSSKLPACAVNSPPEDHNTILCNASIKLIGLLSVLAILSGVQLFCFGLLGEMQMRTYHESQGRPIYRVRATLRGGPG